jgi:4'-phosphopantetheinyl transferase
MAPTEAPAAEDCLSVKTGPSPRSPDVFLSLAEREVLASLRFPKRRREWLMGRWTAKRLFVSAHPDYAGLPLQEISVRNDPDGAPYLSTTREGRVALSLSISHRDDRAFCALLAPPRVADDGGSSPARWAVGADMERVEPRDPAFVNDFFTAAEAAHVWRCSERMRDTLVTVVWSAKEAALKVLRLGLTVDTRRVEIRSAAGIDPCTDAPSDPTSPGGWAALEIHCTLPGTPPICAWWRPCASYVLTLAAFAHATDPPYPSHRPSA